MYLWTDISEDGSGGLTFFVISVTDDSMVKDQKISVRHGFLVPNDSYNRDTWAAWLRDRLQDVETHECNEFFRINGLREFAPHHGNGEDPYRTWHVSDYATFRGVQVSEPSDARICAQLVCMGDQIRASLGSDTCTPRNVSFLRTIHQASPALLRAVA